MSTIFDELNRSSLLPMVVNSQSDRAVPIVNALDAGGLHSLEILIRDGVGFETIRNIATTQPDFLIGAGTIITLEHVAEAIDSGAKFLVSPAVSPTVIRYAQDHDVPIIPGVATATEIQKAYELGIETVKFFPANLMGGPQAIMEYCDLYPMMKFVITGGMTSDYMVDFLKLSSVVACGCHWIFDAQAIDTGAYERISELASKEAVKAANLREKAGFQRITS